jgi:pyridoxal phosphate enzyme (YggS family)
VQEFVAKRPELRGDFTAHCIGRLQSNKVKKALGVFDVVQTVDSLKLGQQLSSEAEKQGKTLDYFLQINISSDGGKSGFLPEAIDGETIKTFLNLTNMRLLGLMTITRFYEEPEDARPDFAALRSLRESLQNQFSELPPLLLSMGMSADYEIAIEEGANVVRVGSAIFGQRGS